jgi:signal transduction histidine kinase
MSFQSDEFDLLNTFAHDLKTPLGAVRNFMDLVEQNGDLNDQQQYYLRRADDAVDRMLKLINELLEYSRVGAAPKLTLAEVYLERLIEDNIILLEGLAAQKRLRIRLDIASDLSPVEGDARMLNNVITNLLINAIKYNKLDGEIFITLNNDSNMVRVTVQDTGIGIAEPDLPRIFDRFYRAKHRTTEKIEGTGLGLAIVKTVVQRHGGQVSAASTLGVGSTFSFTLPRLDIDTDSQMLDQHPDAVLGGSGTFRAPNTRNELPEAATEIPDALDDDSQEAPESKPHRDSDSNSGER